MMRREKFLEVFDNLPTKRKQVLLGILRGDNREKIMADVGVSEAALTQHRRQLYKDFKIEGLQNEADDPRSGERKLPLLIALCAQYQPELISPNIDRISSPSSESLLLPNFSTYNPQTWVGRESIVEELLAKLQGQTRLLWIKGISGIGKTTLGECLASKAWEKERSFEWIYLEILEGQSPDFASVAAELLAKLGDRELDPQERNNPDQLAKRLLQKLQSHSYWIQMDSLERLLNPEQPNQFVDAYWATFLQRFLTDSNVVSRLVLTAQALPTTLVEFSDRYPNTWAEYRLNGLLQLEQLEFFAKRGVVVEPSNQDILTRIAKIYEGHPLVLKVIAEDILKEFAGDVSGYWQVYQPEFEQVARELQATRLDETEYNEALDRKVRERIKKSLEKLPVDALDLLCRSAVFRRPVPKKFWLAMIEDRSLQQQKMAYRVLGDRALIEKEGTDIRQHNLIRAIGYDLLKADTFTWHHAERQAAHLWLTAYEPAPNAPNVETIRGYLEAFDHYCEVDDWEKANEIPFLRIRTSETEGGINEHLFMWSYYHEQLKVLSKLIGKVNPLTDSICSLGLGNVYSSIGNYSLAGDYYALSLKTAQELGNLEKECQALGGLGIIHQAQGDYPQAIKYHQKQLEIACIISDWGGVEAALANLGTVALQRGDYSQALAIHQHSLVLAQKVGNIQGEASALLNISSNHLCLGDYSQAIYFTEKSLKISERISDRSLQSKAFGNLGTVYGCIGDYLKAIKYHDQALKIALEIDNYSDQSTAFKNLGDNYIGLGQHLKSIEYYEQYLAIARKLQDYRSESDALHNLGAAHYQLQNYTSATRYYQQQVTVASQLGVPQIEASVLGNLGVVMAQAGDHEKALEALLKVLGIFRQINDKASEANSLRNLAGLHRKMGRFMQAKEYCEQALALATELGIPLAAECEALQLKIENEQCKMETEGNGK